MVPLLIPRHIASLALEAVEESVHLNRLKNKIKKSPSDLFFDHLNRENDMGLTINMDNCDTKEDDSFLKETQHSLGTMFAHPPRFDREPKA